MSPKRHILIPLIFAAVTLLFANTASADDLITNSRRALQQLVAQNPAAAKCKSKAFAVLVFSDVVKAGFIFGAQGGQGILFIHGQRRGRYRTVAASYGLQAGVQKYGYALLLMNQDAVNWVTTHAAGRSAPGPAWSLSTKEWPGASPPTPCIVASTPSRSISKV
jgi:lipid-binding SYLF domain-containing protein